MKHHIIPFHEWKEKINRNATRRDKDFNSPDNICYLTAEQHAHVHLLLYELYGKWQDKLAFDGLSKRISKEEAIERKLHAPKSEQTRKRMRKPKSTQHRQNISEARKGKSWSEKSWEVISPNGDIHKIIGLAKFCKIYGLDPTIMCKVSQGKVKTHRGWLCKKIGNMDMTSIT